MTLNLLNRIKTTHHSPYESVIAAAEAARHLQTKRVPRPGLSPQLNAADYEFNRGPDLLV